MSKHTEDAAKWTNPFGDMTKVFEQIKIPGVDMAAIIEARRKDIDTLFEANKAVYEGVQALANKQKCCRRPCRIFRTKPRAQPATQARGTRPSNPIAYARLAARRWPT